jgi:formylglycine-generating enzyme required for sulfatase activity/nitrate/TMAO reductase-like tetraheme cytochrome c subunit
MTVTKANKNKILNLYFFAFLLGIVLVFTFNYGWEETSTNEYCESCHIHPQAINSWKIGSHVYNKSGVTVNCVDCHLPPRGFERITAKASAGLKDIYGYFFKDSSDFDWEQMSQREAANHHVYQSGCVNCHQNLFPPELSRKGEDAHLYYDQKKDEIRCINCHLETGHYHEPNINLLIDVNLSKSIYESAAKVESFENFKETISGTWVDFEMVSIPGGTFQLGSPENEEFRNNDEGPQANVKIKQFWIGKTEVSWDEYNVFIKETGKEGRTEDQVEMKSANQKVDAITGPTPAYGNPGQGWGRGKRPAITMTHYAAEKYCEWLSEKTGKMYRLPTEAEWEYACRGNSRSAYYFEGMPSDYTSKGFWKNIFGVDTTTISSNAIYIENSKNRTHTPEGLKPNSFGLLNMLGNVKEFCSDFYSENIYKSYSDSEIVFSPTGPEYGDEYVIRGGSFQSDALDLRISSRDFTRKSRWLMTDPQIPKSLWWYSDCKDVGFRVVCEYTEEISSSKKIIN